MQVHQIGATATATNGNTAIAVSLFSPAQAKVGDNAAGSAAVAVGISSKSGSSSEISGDAEGGGAYTQLTAQAAHVTVSEGCN